MKVRFFLPAPNFDFFENFLYTIYRKHRNIAQSVEQRADNAEVDGPNPSIPTKGARMAMQPIRRSYSLLRDLERDINKYGPPIEW